MGDAVAVFVHGIFSSAETWEQYEKLFEQDPDWSQLERLQFEYWSPKVLLNPLRRIPDYDIVADRFETFLAVQAREAKEIVIVTHSQGGLIVQRFLARMVSKGRGRELGRIRLIVMIACPHQGAQIFMALRRTARFWKHPHERALQPFDKAVTEAREEVVARIVHAKELSDIQCPIEIVSYVADEDGVVPAEFARGNMTRSRTVGGDHFTVIKPDSLNHPNFEVLKEDLLRALRRTPNPLGRGESAQAVNTAFEQSHQPSLDRPPEISQNEETGYTKPALIGHGREIATIRQFTDGRPYFEVETSLEVALNLIRETTKRGDTDG
jgi:pimeloyl-ACP methyl ester carboxylesterase